MSIETLFCKVLIKWIKNIVIICESWTLFFSRYLKIYLFIKLGQQQTHILHVFPSCQLCWKKNHHRNMLNLRYCQMMEGISCNMILTFIKGLNFFSKFPRKTMIYIYSYIFQLHIWQKAFLMWIYDK